MNSALILLGNQLFPTDKIKSLDLKQVFMAEDKGLCTHYRYHKHKIILFLTAMREKAKELKKEGFKVSYYDINHSLFSRSYESKIDDFLKNNKKIAKFYLYEIEDKFFEKKIMKYFEKRELDFEFIKSPMFLTSREDFKTYLDKYDKPFMRTFYQSSRKKFKVLLDENKKPVGGSWSYDKENRKKLPKNVTAPPLLSIKASKTVEKVKKEVDENFPKHPGKSEDFWIPTTREESLEWLDHFIDFKLHNFGAYQDAITQNSDFVFHSVLSPVINMGLLLPDEILQKIESAYTENSSLPLNSIEGFIRQVLGWREFVRGIYQNYSEVQDQRNFWDNHRKLKPCWYKGTTGISVLDDAIKKAQKYSYNHHIERLMIVSNFMLLCEIHPKEVHKWFMEMFSDSSDWVMGPNVYGMGQFSDGGIFATKPYICSSNYYKKMGDYDVSEWKDTVDGLYWRFIEKHIDFYKSNPRMSIMTKALMNLDEDRKQKIIKKANSFIKKVGRD